MPNHLATEKKVMVISMLCEGASIRGIERITNVNRNTIMNLGVRAGVACAKIHDEKIRNIQSAEIQIDEICPDLSEMMTNAAAAVYDASHAGAVAGAAEEKAGNFIT